MEAARSSSDEPYGISLPEDPEEARQKYVKLRQTVRDVFESFLKNLNLKSLHNLEQHFQSKGDLEIADFLRVFTKVFPQPDPVQWPNKVEQRFIVQLAVRLLFESMDVDMGGEVSWMEFVEFVCAIAEELRLKAAEESGQTFEFHEAKITAPFKPLITKCHFDRLYYWTEHPAESALIFEEGQSGFNLHRPLTMARKRRVDGHSAELLSAVFIPKPFEWVVTSANDKTICFWDSTFNLVKRWQLDQVIGTMEWCHEIGVLYCAEHFTEKFRAYRITDPAHVRLTEGTLKPDKTFDLCKAGGHTKAVQSICWMANMMSMATASMDCKVIVYDLVLKKRAHVLTQHNKGVVFLQYCPKNHMLLSGGFDSFICIWDPGAGVLSATLDEHECSVVGLCRVPSTDYEFLSVDFEGVVKLWDVRRLVCLQSFSASDKQAEKAGDLETLEPRAICALGPNRVLVSGRRMVLFDREHIDPHLTADWPINAIAFNQNRIEIITPIKNDLYVWCALTGVLLTVHDNVVDGMITAINLSIGERRFFLGADDGQINVVNYGCGAKLKVLTSHAYEVSQIECIPGKVITLSTPEKLIMIHDDMDPIKSVVLKRINVASAGTTLQIAHDGHGMIACATEDGDVAWFSSEFAKQVSNSEGCAVQHNAAVPCVQYLHSAPLIVSADAESCLMFWSYPPLRTYDFFSKVTIKDQVKDSGSVSVSSLALLEPDEVESGYKLFVGLEKGTLYCVDISHIVVSAKAQQDEVLRRKASGEAAEVISGRIFDTMPKPIDSPEYVFESDCLWTVDKGHRGSIDKIIVCSRQVPVVLTLGMDQCVRIWAHDTGDALGTLEQGLPEGEGLYQPLSPWRFPMDAYDEVEHDRQAVLAAIAGDATENMGEDDDEEELPPPPPRRRIRRSTSKLSVRQGSKTLENLRPGSKQSKEGADAPAEVPRDPAQELAIKQKEQLTGKKERVSSTGNLHSERRRKAMEYVPSSRLLRPPKSKQTLTPFGEDWLAGNFSTHARSSMGGSASLPRLPSGCMRPPASQCKDVTDAAKRLSQALGVARKGRDVYTP